MPTYDMKNTQTGQVTEMHISFAEKQRLIQSGQWSSVLASPKIVSGVGSNINKTSDGWKDLLKRTKKKSGKGNTIKL